MSYDLLFDITSHRFDIALEEDLYEELLRCYGYDNIPISNPLLILQNALGLHSSLDHITGNCYC